MSSLVDLPEVVGFFSYSREDDEAFEGRLSALRDGIQRELSAQLGRSKATFRLWQDQAAIAPGQLWESEIKRAVDQAVFFIPIVTPRAVNSHHCKFEFEAFLARERALGRNDLVFPLLYIGVPALEDEAQWRKDPVLSIVGMRQYVDWRPFRHLDVRTTAVREAIERFCDKIVEALRKPWILPEERRKQQEIEARQRAEEQRRAEAGRPAEEEQQRAEAGRLAEEEQQRAEGARLAEEKKTRVEAARQAEEEKRQAEAARQAEDREVDRPPRLHRRWLAIAVGIFLVMTVVGGGYWLYAEVQQRAAGQKTAEEQQRVAAQKTAEEEQRAAAQKTAEEQQRAAAQKAAEEQQRVAAQKAAEEQLRVAAQKAAEEQQRVAAQKAAEEQQRVAAQKAAEKQQRAGGVAAYNRRDYSTALLTLKPLAEAGDTIPQCYIGVMYLNGQGVPEKPDLALEWLSKAAPTLQPLAQAGDGPAQYCLGVMYLKGKGVPEEPELALEWLSKAASAGISDAQSYMGSFNRRGYLVPSPNYREALRWYLLAAKQDYENAQYNIALMYYNGQVDGRQDLPKAYMWAVISSVGGEPEPIRFRKLLEQKLPASDVAQGQREAILWRSENITPK